MIYERALYAGGHRGTMLDAKGDKQRAAGSNLSLEHLLYSLTLPLSPSTRSESPGSQMPSKEPLASQQAPLVLPPCTLHNSGNDAFMCLFGLQKLLEPASTIVPTVKKTRSSAATMSKVNGMGMPMSMPMHIPMPMQVPMNITGPTAMAPMINFNGVSPPMQYSGFSAITNTMPSSSLPTPLGLHANSISNGRAKSATRPSSAYDLSSEFGLMSMQTQRNSAAGGGVGAAAFLTAPRRLGDGSKRFNSFPSTAKGDMLK